MTSFFVNFTVFWKKLVEILGNFILLKLHKKHTLNVTTSGRNFNTIFDVLTSKMPNADRSKHAFVRVGDFVLMKSELQNKYDRENCNFWPVILLNLGLK